MTDAADTPLPEQLDGEPDLAAEIARLDEAVKALAETGATLDHETDFDGLSAKLDELLSEEGRKALPKAGSRVDQIFARITAVLAENKRNPVPETDTRRPPLGHMNADYSSLPVHARIAAGYGNA